MCGYSSFPLPHKFTAAILGKHARKFDDRRNDYAAMEVANISLAALQDAVW